jgi:Rrf2 family protein
MAKKTGYGLIALTHLARTDRSCVSARAIAMEYGVPLSLLMNVLKILSSAGYVRSYRGPRGGYSLAQPAEELTLAQVMETIEGPIRFVACAARDARGEPMCRIVERCPIHRTVCRIHERIRRFLQEVTVADLAAGKMESPEPEPVAAHSPAGNENGENARLS